MGRFCVLGSIASGLLLLAAAAGGQSDDVLSEKRALPSPGKSKVLKSQLIKVPASQVPLQVPDGFRVGLFAEDLTMPREMESLPSGDVLVVESAAGRVRRLADRDGDGRAEISEEWVSGLKRPYGILYDGGFVYVGNTDSVVRFRVDAAEKAGPREDVIERLQFAGEDLFGSGHWTRDVLFSRDGATLYVSIGSRSNSDAGEPAGRAAILAYAADGSRPRLFATGLRNPVSIVLRPGSDDIWTTVNERDGLGNDLVPDYATRVKPGGFYGWPYYYIGDHPDPRRQGERPDLAGEVIVPDLLIQSHSAPLGLDFYEAAQFPERYHGGLFIGLHGSWNRDPLVGYKVVFVPFRGGSPAGPPEDFLTGFIKNRETGEVLGRPVAPFVARDGSLLVSDDDGGRVWRIEYRKKG
jgi:glucose/arabinose dehydrogenase